MENCVVPGGRLSATCRFRCFLLRGVRVTDRKAWAGGEKNGFTLIEVIAVLIILGILAAVAASRVGGGAATEIQTRTETLKVHLRHAQLRALNSGGPSADPPAIWGIRSNGNEYWLFLNNINAEHRLPGEDADRVNAGPMTLGTFTIAFDYYGRPLDDPADPAGSLRTGDLTIGTGAAQPITITRQTGFIP